MTPAEKYIVKKIIIRKNLPNTRSFLLRAKAPMPHTTSIDSGPRIVRATLISSEWKNSGSENSVTYAFSVKPCGKISSGLMIFAGVEKE